MLYERCTYNRDLDRSTGGMKISEVVAVLFNHIAYRIIIGGLKWFLLALSRSRFPIRDECRTIPSAQHRCECLTFASFSMCILFICN